MPRLTNAKVANRRGASSTPSSRDAAVASPAEIGPAEAGPDGIARFLGPPTYWSSARPYPAHPPAPGVLRAQNIARNAAKSTWNIELGPVPGPAARFSYQNEIKNPRSKLRGIGGRKEADQKNAASCGEYVPKEIQPRSRPAQKRRPLMAGYIWPEVQACPSSSVIVARDRA